MDLGRFGTGGGGLFGWLDGVGVLAGVGLGVKLARKSLWSTPLISMDLGLGGGIGGPFSTLGVFTWALGVCFGGSGSGSVGGGPNVACCRADELVGVG